MFENIKFQSQNRKYEDFLKNKHNRIPRLVGQVPQRFPGEFCNSEVFTLKINLEVVYASLSRKQIRSFRSTLLGLVLCEK